MTTVRYTADGGHYRVGGHGFDPGDEKDVDDDLADHLADHDDFINLDEFVSRPPEQVVVDIENGVADGALVRVAELTEHDSVRGAAAERYTGNRGSSRESSTPAEDIPEFEYGEAVPGDPEFAPDGIEFGELPFNPEAHTVAELEDKLADVDDPETVRAIGSLEEEQEDRDTAIEAVEGRLDELED